MDLATFAEFLENKKINSQTFQQTEPEKWQALAKLYEQMHPESFTAQKKFLFNDLRHKYPLGTEAS